MAFRVVYLDDEPALLEIFSDTFASDKIEIQTFSDPAQAIISINSSPPDLVFLDFRLPNTTGVEVAQKLPTSIPKALITGDLSIDDNKHFKAIFEKPIKVSAIEEFIDSFARK